ncbi:3-dehydroquinate synthase [Ruminiclostridium sufflavum DSM 19573]|uniref:3-dehydroquinate synthase n=1 Tax=Ruminiclostridium sufflavum DSM 19573 TaxID=1121337 RepID=A0A318XMK8_9FIRM|nr:3-dehydroquinate synthase [Ruminiclostridium sufflavum]PYG86879.1 3-dehydroquinate synthase [Ruminiclostridium sufflavum DSM 19573]
MIRHMVNLKERSYPICITTSFDDFGKTFLSLRTGKKLLIVTDENVDKYYSDICSKELENNGFEVSRHVLAPGEQHKNLEAVYGIYQQLVEYKFDRTDTLVALGGGVVGDITGFAAATYMRGINFVQVPTTLLSQADSSVGGKTGVDFNGHKNVIGAFYQPKLVFINVNTIKTLPKREVSAGLAEVIKHGLILDEEYCYYINENAEKIFNYDENVLQYLAKKNCAIKGSVVEEDEKENELRAILNFGHTIGHAVETVQNFSLLHGECVSIGIAGAFRLSLYLGAVNEAAVENVKKMLLKLELPVSLPGLDVEKVYSHIFYDKKVKDNKLKFVLPRRIGEVFQCNIEDSELIKKVLFDLSK